MLTTKIQSIIHEGEGLRIEFKECRSAINRDVYETVCAFLNRHGGELLLGVNDNGQITGIDPGMIGRIKTDFVTTINNATKITPAVYLSLEQMEIEGKQILYIYIPESSQVHKCNGRIFDRNQDGDLDVTNHHQLVTGLYLNKQTFYTEKMVDLRSDLIGLARQRAGFQRDNHPWKNLNDKDLLKSAKLYSKDFQTNREGFSLAGILLFGKDETILSAIPHHKTDLILRRQNLDRYDDRDDVRTNLIESYERMSPSDRNTCPIPFTWKAPSGSVCGIKSSGRLPPIV